MDTIDALDMENALIQALQGEIGRLRKENGVADARQQMKIVPPLLPEN